MASAAVLSVPRPSAGADAGDPPIAPQHRVGWRVGRHLLVVVAFSLPAVALWWHAWDGHLASTLSCACGDAGQTVWFVAWPAYALAHGLDPFFSGAVQAPYGVNLLNNASAVPVGILLAPITLTAGPVAATNVALTLCPGLSAWACWVACRSLVGWAPAAAVAGVLFGYSPFVVTNLALGHLGLALVVAPPLLLVAARRILFGQPAHGVRWGAIAGGLLALQFLLSSEVLAIVVVVGLPCVLVAVLTGRRALAPGRELALAGAAAGIVAVVLMTLPVWFFIAGPQHLHGPLWQGASLQGNALESFWSPGHYRAAAGTLLRFGGYEGRAGPPSAYLGPVVLALAALSILVAWRRRTAWLLASAALLAASLSLGAVLWWTRGHLGGAWAPWRMFASWPLLDDVIPQRFSVVTDLCVALLIGVGIDGAARARRHAPAGRHRADVWHAVVAVGIALCSVAAVISVWLTYQVPFVTRRVTPPAWYTVAAPRVPQGTIVVSYPFPFPLDGSSAPMVWQAIDGMRFRLAGGYVKVPGRDGRPLSDRPPPKPYDVLAPLTARAAGRLPVVGPPAVAAVRAALLRWHVDGVVVTQGGRDPALAVRLFTRAIGRPASREHGAWVWQLRAGL